MKSIARTIASTISRTVGGQSAGGGGSSFDFIGTNALAAYGVAPLKTGVSRCFRVFRSSDSTEQDCNSIAQAVSFAGAGNGSLSKWYDQASTKDQLQATSTRMPRIVNSGSGEAGVTFDGVNDCMAAATRATSGSPSAFSYFSWIKPTSFANFGVIGSEFSSATSQRSWVLYLFQTTGVMQLSTSSSGSNSCVYTTQALTLNAWQHVGFTFNAGTVQFYVDGLPVSTTVESGTPFSSLFNTSEPFAIGAEGTSGTPVSLFIGQMWSCAIYSGVKSDADVLAIKNAVTPS